MVRRYAGFVADLLLVWAMVGFFAVILARGIAGPGSPITFLVACVFWGPGFVFLLAAFAYAYGGCLRASWRHTRRALK